MVEVSTDKVDAEVPAPASGTVSKILVQVDEEIEVGKALAEIDPNGAGPTAEKGPGKHRHKRSRRRPRTAQMMRGRPRAKRGATREMLEEAPSAEGEEVKATTDDASVSAGKSLEGGGLEIVMPEMGESVTEGTVLEWHVSEGDSVEEGDTVVEVSTDKVDAEVPAPASGTITKVLVGPDETIEVGKPLAEMTKGAPSGDGGAPAASADTGAEAPRPPPPTMRGRAPARPVIRSRRRRLKMARGRRRSRGAPLRRTGSA